MFLIYTVSEKRVTLFANADHNAPQVEFFQFLDSYEGFSDNRFVEAAAEAAVRGDDDECNGSDGSGVGERGGDVVVLEALGDVV